MLHDQHQRTIATDPKHSYIVEAPAGSGKTEILTQRFLRLLAQVQAPEQIIALTFTRKAANEMRERVLSTLRAVATGVEPNSAHQQLCFHYAQQALKQNQHLHWNLLHNGNRLRIMTIDALCQMLAQAIPLHSSHYATISEQPQVLYFRAARDYVQMATDTPAYQADLKILLQHLDNRQDLLIVLFVQVLAQRDQWLSSLFQVREQSKEVFEQALQWIEQHELARFCGILSSDLQQALFVLIKKLLNYGQLDNPKLAALEHWHRFSAITAEQAHALASLLLTSNQSLRKGFDHHIGLKRERCPEPFYSELKAESQALFETLNTLPEWTEALIHISHLPKPEFAPAQWEVLQALFRVLPLLVAHLELAFQTHSAIDFCGIAYQAKLALGHMDAPSDLALYLDHHIQHLLIDEFQDTSLQQFDLITQLIQGWEPQDGRTLFIVGDPMQSIYRFRAAEVGLFLRAKTQGIGPVALQPLQLTVNFRSTKPIVDWINQHFAQIFPEQDDIASGAVSFHAAIPMSEQEHATNIQAHHFSTTEAEAIGVLEILQEELQTYPDSSIAILVRSRSQLRKIVALLRQHNLPFQGVDIDLLAQLPHLRDVWSLTQAFLQPANRLAWLAVLRSPWVGLNLADILVIAQYHKSIYLALADHASIPDLSIEARVRVRYIYHVFQTAYRQRQHFPLVETLVALLNQLHQDAILSRKEQEDLEQYWSLLRQFTVNEQILDYALFQEQFNALYAQKSAQSRIQIMTIHKSKGLEFDCVLLPGLGTQPQNSERGLLRWLKLPRQDEEDLFLVSPIKAVTEEECQVYHYLEHLDTQKAFYEAQRLLYVAATRAKQRLYLLDGHANLRKKSFRHMLSTQPFQTKIEPDSINQTTISPTAPILQRLPVDYYQNTIEPKAFQQNNEVPLFAPALPRLIGIVTHSILQWICTYHPATYQNIPWSLAKRQLITMGFAQQELAVALEQIQMQIQAFLQDSRGQWIAKQRPDERNEWAILSQSPSGTKIIDRTFTEQNIRWIIDFKTGAVESHHRTQLEQYAELFHATTTELDVIPSTARDLQQPQGDSSLRSEGRATTALPIRCGLYYLTTLQWIEWESVVWKTSCT